MTEYNDIVRWIYRRCKFHVTNNFGPVNVFQQQQIKYIGNLHHSNDRVFKGRFDVIQSDV